MAQPEIPIIDIAPFRDNRDTDAADHVVETIRRACEDIGFFVILGHGVPQDLVERMYRTSRAFFDLPGETKARVGHSGDQPGGLMYFPMQAESLAASRGEQRPGDLKESLDYGPGFSGGPWPHSPAGLQAVWHEYYEAMSELARDLRRIFARGIGLSEDYFEDKFDRHHSSLRVIDYVDQTEEPLPGQLRAGEHTDYGFLTILRSEDSSGGLQVRPHNGDWMDVPTVADSFVVNIGDVMMRWTNDRWVSTLHRVVNPSSRHQPSRRISIPFFHNPNVDAVVECLDAFRDADHPARYEPVRYGDYALMRYRQTHGETA